jgi:hypothetical protein
MKSLTPFTPSDFDAFAGVEADEPLICYLDGAVVIVDDFALTLMDDAENEWRMEYPSPATAEAVANAIITEMEAAGAKPVDLAEKFHLTLI